MPSGTQPGVCRHRLKSPFNLIKPTGGLSPARAVYPPRCSSMLPSPEPFVNAYLNSDWRLCESSSEGSLWIGLPPVGRSFCMAPSSHISPKGRLELFLCQRRHFPTSWGTDCAHGACLPDTSRGCRNSVTPDTLSSSSLRLARVMPLFGSARYEQWLCRMYGGQVAHRSMGGERSVANRHIPPQILYVTLDLHSLVGGVSHSSFPDPPPDTAERYTGRSWQRR